MNEDEQYEESLVDLSNPAPWITSDIEAALNNFLEILWESGVSVPGTTITLPELPGNPISLATDFGIVHFKEQNS